MHRTGIILVLSAIVLSGCAQLESVTQRSADRTNQWRLVRVTPCGDSVELAEGWVQRDFCAAGGVSYTVQCPPITAGFSQRVLSELCRDASLSHRYFIDGRLEKITVQGDDAGQQIGLVAYDFGKKGD